MVNNPVAIMTEITNTPWGEKYAKCFRWEDSESKAKSVHEFHKEFHVSPFIGMDVEYDWRFLNPRENQQGGHVSTTRIIRLLFCSFVSKTKKDFFKNLSYALFVFLS